MATMPISRDESAMITTSEIGFSVSQEISGVPYVWQEVNGFCFPSSLSMVLQSMGLDLSLYDILAATGSGFSMVSISVNEAMTFFPGVMVRQIPWLEFFTDLYGLELGFFLDSGTEYGWNALQILTSIDCEVNDYADAGSTSPFDMLRNTIDAGYPLTISVDTYYLPPVDWDIVREYVGPMQPGGTSHAIVIVGYNETAGTVRVYDPGVGLMEPYVGYPDDGRWNYTMTYSQLDNAWQSAGYVTFKVTNGTGPASGFEDRLATYIAQRLLGNRTSYFEGNENFFYLGTGPNAFRGMGLDMALEPIRDYCYNYMEVNKPMAIRRLGQNLESMMTIQYMAYRSSLNSLPDLLPSYDLTEFIEEASEALPHMDALSHNASMTGGVFITPRDTILYNTFFGMASSFESSHDLDGSITEFSEELEEIADHLYAIADVWETAGKILERLVPTPSSLPNGNLIVIIGGGAGVLVIGLICVIRRRGVEEV